MYKKALYNKVYRMLDHITPLSLDCGLLCDHRCCKGDIQMGMILYPGEKVMFDPCEEFLEIRKELLHNSPALFAVCKGTCERRFRPLSCRIYPLVPYLDASGTLTVIEDPRAKYICPLLMKFDELQIRKQYVRKVREVFQHLLQDKEILHHVALLSEVLDEYLRFTK